MSCRYILGLASLTALGLALLLGFAVSQQKTLKDQLVGTWTQISIDATSPGGAARLWTRTHQDPIKERSVLLPFDYELHSSSCASDWTAHPFALFA